MRPVLAALLLVLAPSCRERGSAQDGGAPPEPMAAPAKPRQDAGAGKVDLDAYLAFQRARIDALAKKLPAAAARESGLQASGLSAAELKEIDQLVLAVTDALAQARSDPAVAIIPELEQQLTQAPQQERPGIEARLREAKRLEVELGIKALVPVRKRYGDAAVDQVLSRQNDLAQLMYYKANALVPARE